MADLTDSIHTYLTTAPASGFAGRAVTVRDHWSGDDNLLWRVDAGSNKSDSDAAVVKLFLDAGQARGRRQFDGQQLFASLGIAPQPLWFDRYPEGLARQVLVYRWVDGDYMKPGDDTHLAMLAKTAARVHNADAAAVRRISPRAINLEYFWRVLSGGLIPLLQRLEQRGCAYTAALLAALAEHAATIIAAAMPLWQSAPPAPIHGDLKLDNAMIAHGRAVLLDWEMFGLGDPALEVATFLFEHAQALGAQASATWRRGYFDAAQSADIDQRIDLYLRLLPLQRFTSLLHGLHQLSAADRADPALRASAADLLHVITVAGERAAAALAVDSHLDPDRLRSDFMRLILGAGA